MRHVRTLVQTYIHAQAAIISLEVLLTNGIVGFEICTYDSTTTFACLEI